MNRSNRCQYILLPVMKQRNCFCIETSQPGNGSLEKKNAAEHLNLLEKKNQNSISEDNLEIFMMLIKIDLANARTQFGKK